MEAPQKRAREDAATERPHKKYKCRPLSDTAAKQQDLSALSKPELRALVASARALARRADGRSRRGRRRSRGASRRSS